MPNALASFLFLRARRVPLQFPVSFEGTQNRNRGSRSGAMQHHAGTLGSREIAPFTRGSLTIAHAGRSRVTREVLMLGCYNFYTVYERTCNLKIFTYVTNESNKLKSNQSKVMTKKIQGI
ncbi:hypothetical protein PUN28_004334 [Cardiocondyla obscurior]|uniref:Uncharacterized protein n=1 Tax=Cardiocondyla obscurior TaxID=286306 RepID=A0AAW2GBY5_9HYME